MSDRENGTKDSDDDSPVVSKRRSRSSRSSSSVSRSRSRSRRRYSRSRSRSGSRRRYYSRSRSRSPYYRRRRSRYYSRSRSRSYSPYNRYRSSSYRSRYRSRSRSPMSNRRRHLCSREDPKVSRCVGVFGLSLYTQERDLKEVFSRYGPLEEVQVVYDHQTGRSRGFAFLYFRNIEDAMEAKEMAPGTEIDGRKIRVDYSITERAHTPTPGIYLGKTTGYRSYRRSRSPYSYRRGYSRSRSRSRSYSPRRYSSRY